MDSERLGRQVRHKLFLLEILLAVGFLVAVALPLFRGGITGFVSAETETQNISVDITDSSEFTLRSADKSALPITGFTISGRASGGVALFLANQRGELHLIYTNLKNASKRGSLITSITGAATAETGPQAALVFEPGGLLLPLPVPSDFMVLDGPFQQECIETCILQEGFADSSYSLRAFLAKGASLHLREITYTVARP